MTNEENATHWSKADKEQYFRNLMLWSQEAGTPFIITYTHGDGARGCWYRAYIDGIYAGSACGGGYDIRASAVADAFNRYFADDIAKYYRGLPEVFRKNLRGLDEYGFNGAAGWSTLMLNLGLVFGAKISGVFDDTNVLAFVPTKFVPAW